MFKKIIVNIFFILLVLLVIFFGLGPVLFADGSAFERGITFLIVIFIYGLLFYLYRLWRSRSK